MISSSRVRPGQAFPFGETLPGPGLVFHHRLLPELIPSNALREASTGGQG